MHNHSSPTRHCQRNRLLAEPAIRQSKRRLIADLFAAHLGKRYDSRDLHVTYGSGLRSRISDINADPHSPIRIVNETISTDDGERSFYWSEPRRQAESLFGSLAPERRHRDDG